jgi:non-ribosomal peptide synthetase component F
MDLEQSMAARFEQQACRYPNHLAVKSKYYSLTYGELDRRANRVARAILACDKNADSPVALLGKQGAPMIVASLGALKAGKPYAPIDYMWPPAKTMETLKQLSSALVLADNDNFAPAHELVCPGVRVVNVEALDSQFSDATPALTITPDRIAYIHFTSGSTGEPKGVAASHRAELHNIAKNTNALKISPDDRVSLLRSNNAGAARDTWLALLNGATLCTLELREAGLATLGRWLNQEEITVFTCVTTVYRQALRTLADNERLKSVRLIHVGGEPVTPGDVDLYKKHFADDCKFVVRYSISETPAVSYFFIDKKTAIDGEHVPVGMPLEGNEVSILDEDGNQVGAGAIGEIAVKSRYLATGYWRQPQLTKQRFVDDPGGGKARIYRTGDFGYCAPTAACAH